MLSAGMGESKLRPATSKPRRWSIRCRRVQATADSASRWGLARQPDASDGHIVTRCVQPLVDEGQRLLAEGVAQRASDIDLVWVLGYGFPASKGGPLWWAARQGQQTLPQPVVS